MFGCALLGARAAGTTLFARAVVAGIFVVDWKTCSVVGVWSCVNSQGLEAQSVCTCAGVLAGELPLNRGSFSRLLLPASVLLVILGNLLRRGCPSGRLSFGAAVLTI